ncbi:MAG: hypothetical protein K2K45_01860 [Muribaculaceae bacterium]|nr:hypothetical protein [Muribaculaceae bacterium]
MDNTYKYGDKSFSLERFEMLAKSDFIINKGTYLKLLLTALGVFVALSVLISINAISDINELKKFTDLTDVNSLGMIKARQISYSSMYFGIGLWMMSIGLTVSGSLTFSSLSSKKQRITAFMEPVSLCEKFSLRMLVYLFGGIVALAIGFFIGYAVIQVSFGGGKVMMEGIHDFLSNVDESGYIVAIFILLGLFGNSLYALGSSLWPRLSWLKTTIVIMAVQWIVAIFLMMGIFSNFNFEDFFNFDSGEYVFLWIVICILSILNIGCWLLAWLQFRNTQIIQRFMKK